MAIPPSLPCTNPSCKSYGHPHWGCKCHGESSGKVPFAEGGEVSHFCSEKRSHLPSCEHYFKGEDPEHAIPCAIAHGGLLSISRGNGSLFDHIDKKNLGSSIGHFSSHVDRGHKKINNHIESLFGGADCDDFGDKLKDREKAKTLIEKGLNHHNVHAEEEPEHFAKGGEAEKKQKLAELLPAHNVLLSAARGRAHDYLNGLRPHSNSPKLAFDDHIPDHDSERRYHSALDVANDPMSVLKHAKKGTLLPEHVQHLGAMYPELKAHMDKGLTDRVVKAQLAKEKPPYHVRQSLSMFLGAPLGGEMTPEAIQAAQATFHQKPQQQQGGAPQPGKNKRGTSALSKIDDNAWTDNQAAEKRKIADR